MIAIFLKKKNGERKNLNPYTITPIKKDNAIYSLPNIVEATSATRELEILSEKCLDN